MNTDVYDFLTRVGRGGGYGYFWIVSGSGEKITKSYDLNRAMPTLSDEGDIYFAVHPVNRIMRDHERGKDDAVMALACLYAEFDGKSFVSLDDVDMAPWIEKIKATSRTKNEKTILGMAERLYQETIFCADRLTYLKSASYQIKNLRVAPSYTIYSGGGYHCYWLLEEPFMITDDATRLRAEAMQYDWVAYVGGDPSCKDLKRVLRMPGTFNRKKKYGAPIQVCFVPGWSFPERTYNFDELEMLSAPLVFDVGPTEPAKKQAPRVYDTIYTADEQGQDMYDFTLEVIRAFNAKYTQAQILARNDYTPVEGSKDRWNRPGGDSAGVVVFESGRMYSFSDNDELFHANYGGTGAHDAYSIFVELECSGNTKLARSKAAKELGIVRKAPVLDLSTPENVKRVARHAIVELF